MARGWGRNEEDLGAEKEQARLEARAAVPATAEERAAAGRRRSLELSLARIEDELGKTEHPARRQALEAAREEIRARIAAIA